MAPKQSTVRKPIGARNAEGVVFVQCASFSTLMVNARSGKAQLHNRGQKEMGERSKMCGLLVIERQIRLGRQSLRIVTIANVLIHKTPATVPTRPPTLVTIRGLLFKSYPVRTCSADLNHFIE